MNTTDKPEAIDWQRPTIDATPDELVTTLRVLEQHRTILTKAPGATLREGRAVYHCVVGIFEQWLRSTLARGGLSEAEIAHAVSVVFDRDGWSAGVRVRGSSALALVEASWLSAIVAIRDNTKTRAYMNYGSLTGVDSDVMFAD